MRIRLPAVPVAPDTDRVGGNRGAALLDAVIAVGLVVTIANGVAWLIVWQRRATWSAGMKTIAVGGASEKIERLQALTWEVDPSGVPASDGTTDLSTEPSGPGGTGLRPSPSGTLTTNTPRFVDYLDADGRWRGTGAAPPGDAAFVRRWSIEPFAGDPSNTLILTVVVLPLADAAVSDARQRGARLTVVRTRVVR